MTPPALIAATPVGATTIIRLGETSLGLFKKVVLPVPAVRKRLVPVFCSKLKARSNCWFVCMAICDIVNSHKYIENIIIGNVFDTDYEVATLIILIQSMRR